MSHKEYKLFLRYLKERGLYTLFERDSNKTKHYISRKEKLLSADTDEVEGIMLLITWSETIYMGKLWAAEYIKYKRFYNNGKNIKNIKKFTLEELE